MTEQVLVDNVVEILGRPYSIRCAEAEVDLLQQAAEYLNKKMREVQESGKTANTEKIAIIAALNIVHDYLQVDQQKHHFMSKINQKIAYLQNKLDAAINHALQNELVYASD